MTMTDTDTETETEAVIFDMDGTLLDTERIYQKYWNMAGRELGYDLTPEDYLEFRSLGHSFGVKLMEEKVGRGEAYDEIRNYRVKLMEPVMQQGLVPLKPYVKEGLSLLRGTGVSLAVATATPIDTALEHLERAGIRNYFDRVISARMVKEGKPAPDVYLYACQELGIEPRCAWAVEDAPNGVMSAASAGLRTIMVPDLTEPDIELEKLIVYRAPDLRAAAEYIIQHS